MLENRSRRQDQIGPWQCMKWVLLVCSITSIWQVIQLSGPSGMFLGPQPYVSSSSDALSDLFLEKLAALQNTKLKVLVQGLGLTVPAESPFAASGEPAAIAATTPGGARAAATREAQFTPEAAADLSSAPNGDEVAQQGASTRRVMDLDGMSFSAEGPLDVIASGGEAAAAADDEEPPGSDGTDTVTSDPSSDISCSDAHPNADSADMLHVMYACDLNQLEGAQASIASVVQNVAEQSDLTIHLMVQKKWLRLFKVRFGIPQECSGVVTGSGVLIKVHSIRKSMIQKAIAKVAPSVRQQRGAIDTVENFARFYMHLVIERAVVVYLDADTIVQADLGKLRTQLLMSNKTVGFVQRETPVWMDQFLQTPKDCKSGYLPLNKFPEWKSIMKMPAYNVGIFVVNLQRWHSLNVVSRVEEAVDAHNQCHGKLWLGGSQPPLLLAFLNRSKDEPPDFIELDAAWNRGDLGWRHRIPDESLKDSFVLHWNGNQKPWFPNGLYKEYWIPWRGKFEKLLRPFEDNSNQLKWSINSECIDDSKAYNCDDTCAVEGGYCDVGAFQNLTSNRAIDKVVNSAGHACEQYSITDVALEWDGPWILGKNCGFHRGPTWQASCSIRPVCGYKRICPCLGVRAVKTSEIKDPEAEGPSGKRRSASATPSSQQVAAREKCPHVELLDQWQDDEPKACVLGETYGCADNTKKTMWAKGGCSGMFRVSNVVTACGQVPKDINKKGPQQTVVCESGQMPSSEVGCGLMLLTSYFTTKKDWQREEYVKPSFSKFKKLYQSTMKLGLSVTMIYDELPESILQLYGCDRWRFHKVNLQEFDKRYGVNDVRYFFFNRLVEEHTEWANVFVIDAFDVRVKMNPCPLQADKLYVGVEREKLQGHPWMKARFKKMGTKYQGWYEKSLDPKYFIMNCGITGGERSIMLWFFELMMDIISDPNLAVKKKGDEDINVNMAALNYIAYNDLKGKTVSGHPVHSAYKRFENRRNDVWFVHK